MIPYGHQFIDKNDINSVIKALKSDWLTQGPKVLEFEKALADYCGAKYAVAVSSGTAALHLAYLALGLKKGDEVIIPANTFASTANMAIACGAKPVFCDIRMDSYNIDESKIAKLITKKTKAIVPVHFAGQPANMDVIWRLAHKHHLKVVEDAAHALGAKYGRRRIGNGDSAMATFSFHPVKTITTGEGGAIMTNHKEYYEQLIKLRSHGIGKNKQGFNSMDRLGFNYRLTDIQAALGLSQLKKLKNFMVKRKRVAGWYCRQLRNIPQLVLPCKIGNTESAWHLFVIRVKNTKERLGLKDYLQAKGIGTQIHYPPVYLHPYYQKHGYTRVDCKNAQIYGDTCLSIPIYPSLRGRQVSYISSRIKSYFNQ